MKSILVFCGSKMGNDSMYKETAYLAGKIIAEKGAELVYGGGGVGLMGVTARAALEHNGEVVGIIPDFLKDIEGINLEIKALHLVKSMHERKQKMAQMSNAVLVLPGGFGTLDELFEILTLIQLKQGSWPIGILNVGGYYDHLIAHMQQMREAGFLFIQPDKLLHISEDVEQLISFLMEQPDFVKRNLERL